MDYYIVVNGQKTGPYDLLGFIKKVKNGLVTPETLVATHEEGPFVPAAEIKEVSDIIAAETGKVRQVAVPHSTGPGTSFRLGKLLADGVELWTRRVIEYTLFMGVIIVAGFFCSLSLKKIQLIADYPFISNYVVGVICTTLLGLFFYYVLVTKRSQDPDKQEIKAVMKISLPTLLLFAAILSLSTLVFGINPIISISIIAIMLFAISFLIFVPFLVVDHRMNLRRAVLVSLESFRAMKGSTMAIIFILVGINIAAAVLPGFLANDLVLLGLMVSMPITVASLAYIYDQALA